MTERIELAGTAIVMELPNPVKQAVQKLREWYDPLLANKIPVEITIAGSSGTGSISQGQDGAVILEQLAGIAKKMKPIKARLGKVTCFQGTQIFVFEVKPQEPFIVFNRLLRDASIVFEKNKYPFFPHCSLHIWGEVSALQEAEMLRQTVPGSFWLDSFALYQLVEGKTAVLVERFNLAGSK